LPARRSFSDGVHFSSFRAYDISLLFGLDAIVTVIASVVLFVAVLAVTLTRSSLSPLAPSGSGWSPAASNWASSA
jgi:hypothetical protein